MFTSINPATQETIATYEAMTKEEVDTTLDRAETAYREWRATPLQERIDTVRKVAEVLRERLDENAAIITVEMGKTLAEARAEIEKCAGHTEYFADNASRILAPDPIPDASRSAYVAYEPIGTVLAVMPWNYPFWQVFRFAIPALLAGNTAVLKHASNVMGCAMAIERVFAAAGLPEGAFQVLRVPSSEIEEIIQDRRIAAVTLTGSEDAGRSVAAAAGRAIKKSVLELGGSDPFIVLDDADVQTAAEVGAKARFQNAGQTCIAAKRFIVMDSVADEFKQAFIEATRKIVVGDPTDGQTTMGPLSRPDLRETLDEQVRRSTEQGASTLYAGDVPEGDGNYYPPVILGNVTREMPVFREETFGPVAAIVRVGSVEEAIEVANDTIYGLSSNLWTRDIQKAKEIAGKIEAGAVFINGMSASSPPVPFGGVKQSGYGRELSAIGMREFTNVQSVWVERE